jgi:hypothetical protein
MSKPSNTPDELPTENDSSDEPSPPDSADRIDQSIIGKSEETGAKTAEYGGPAGLEPTRYGDWESKGRCVDF